MLIKIWLIEWKIKGNFLNLHLFLKMRDIFNHIVKIVLVFAFIAYAHLFVSARDFVVVLDAGHGGKDCGAVGKYAQEKDITLSVTKLLGEKIKGDYDDVKVVYTRNVDKYLTLQQRAKIANDAKGDLFISIHVNSVEKSTPGRANVAGASVYTLGLHRSEDNLAVAKRENSVIELEKDYSTSYSGFNPNSPESYIMFEMNQNKHMMQSIEFADLVQKELINSSNRKDKGVRQAGFWVLWATSMPSVLIELDFICNPMQEDYLASKDGQVQLAESIYFAFQDYYDSYVNKVSTINAGSTSKAKNSKKTSATASKVIAKSEEKTKSEECVHDKKIDKDETVYRIQILTSNRQLKDGAREFNGLGPVWRYKDGAMYKYTVESTTSLKEANKLLKSVQSKFPQAFVVEFRGDERVK